MTRGFRLTRAGWLMALLCGALALVSALSGNNLHVLLLGGLLAAWLVEGVLGRINLLGLSVRRVLKGDCYAGVPVAGQYIVYNRREGPTPTQIIIEEWEGHSRGVVPRVAATTEVEVPTQWMFDRRGRVRLDRIRMSSRFPFGLVERWRVVHCPGEWIVFPKPLAGWSESTAGPEDGDGQEWTGRGGTGEPFGLRQYRHGDPLHQIHWRTSARRDEPLVIERQTPTRNQLLVHVRGGRGLAWETELSRACGQVVWGFRRGFQVGLILPGEQFEAQRGSHWRQHLLEALALQPHGDVS